MKQKNFYFVLFIIFLIMSLSSCTKQSKNSTQKFNDSVITINTIEDFKREVINVMSQIDLTPYYEKQIEKKRKVEEGNNKQKKANESEEKGGFSGQQSEGEGQQKETGAKSGSTEKFQAEPVNDRDLLLMVLLKQEDLYKMEEHRKGNERIPDDIVFVWHEINDKINQLHLKWNDLEARLNKSEISKEDIKNFGDTLNILTILSNQNKYLETLIAANRLTSYFPKFIRQLNDSKLAAVFSIKYYTRKIVLDIAENNYTAANKDIEALQYDEKVLSAKLVEEKYKDSLDKLSLSISDLKKSVFLKDIDLVKVKASIIIKNVNFIKDEI